MQRIFKVLHQKITWALLPLLTLTWSCEKPYEKPDGDYPDYIVFGSDFPWCNDETCVEIFRMNESGVQESGSGQHVDPAFPYAGDYSIDLSIPKYQQIEMMFRGEIPDALFDYPSGYIGNSTEFTGYLYFEYKAGDVHKWWLIEQNFATIPTELLDFTTLLQNAVFAAQAP
jgi:hypothetical protein